MLTRLRTSSSLRTSAWTKRASAPSSSSSATNSCPWVSRRPDTTSCAPSSAKMTAAARPMPVSAPVINTTGELITLAPWGEDTDRAHVPTASPPRSTSSALDGKAVAEHGATAFGLRFRRFVLNHVPMLDEDSIDHANEVRNNPVLRLPKARKATVDDHELALRNNLLMVMPERWRQTLNQIEETVAAGFDVGAVLHVVR